MQSGAWPPGVSLVDNGNGTDSISGVVAGPGAYHLHLAESNAAGRCSDVIGLVVAPKKPTFESPGSVSVPVHTLLEFPVIASGIPTAKISIVRPCKGQACSQWPNFPAPLQIKTSNGVPVLVGSPQKPGTIRFSLKAANSAGSATQTFTLAVLASSTTTTSSPTTSSHHHVLHHDVFDHHLDFVHHDLVHHDVLHHDVLHPYLVHHDEMPDALRDNGSLPERERAAERVLIGKNGALYRYDQAASGAWGSPQSMGGDLAGRGTGRGG